jgi:hypothetical protein
MIFSDNFNVNTSSRFHKKMFSGFRDMIWGWPDQKLLLHRTTWVTSHCSQTWQNKAKMITHTLIEEWNVLQPKFCKRHVALRQILCETLMAKTSKTCAYSTDWRIPCYIYESCVAERILRQFKSDHVFTLRICKFHFYCTLPFWLHLLLSKFSQRVT